VIAAVDIITRLKSVANDPALALFASRRKFVDCAFEAVKSISLTSYVDVEAFLVFVSTGIALAHKVSFGPRPVEAVLMNAC